MLGIRKAVSTGGTIRIPQAKTANLDTREYSFAKFAATYFHSSASGQYSKRPLKRSLLDHDLPIDDVAAQAIWIMMLRFMGDMAEAKYEDEALERRQIGAIKSSIMQRLTMTLSKAQAQSKEFREALEAMNESNQQRLIRKTLKRTTKLPELLRKTQEHCDEIEYYQHILNTRNTNLDKLHFIIGHGILKPNLRDEILAQICKQLTNNPYRVSFAKGWILLSLCIGCFAPTPRFENYLRSFIQNGPALYAPYCQERLERTLKNGSRTQPPSWLELQATRNKMPIVLDVHLMDGSVKKLQVDSASTAKEAVAQLASHMGLLDSFGFSIVISLFDKMMSLGNGREHILDAISNCEQYAKEQGQNERKAPWKLYLRKEMFATWYTPSEDQLATHLIYKQVTRGLNAGEYCCRTERDVAMICALEYYAENGADLDRAVLRKLIPDYVPKDFLATGEKAIKAWEAQIADVFNSNEYVKQGAPAEKAKEDICLFAHLTWPMLFSRFFEAVRVAGPKLVTDNVVIAVNATGIYFIDDTEQVLAEISYAELCAIYAEEDAKANIDELCIETVQSENFTFKCYESQDIAHLISFMVDNLKKRSTYAIAMQDYRPEEVESENRLPLSKGDLVELMDGINGAWLDEPNNRWARGKCGGQEGEFPVDIVSVLATLQMPANKIVQVYKESMEHKPMRQHRIVKGKTVERHYRHTLRKFADDHFRPNLVMGSSTEARTIHTLKSRTDELWRHSRDQLKAPLLKNLQQNPELFEAAVTMFKNILKYMGDVPRGKLTANTDLIFQPALEDELLRDELFCQLMKQLTDNRIQHSLERGWDLMYLATGIMVPGSLVLKELTEFLRTRSHIIAAESSKRVKRTISKGQRKCAPYIIEVEGIQHRCMHIYHKIYFPDCSVEAFEIESLSRASDLADAIARRLHLKSREGFSLFVKISDKVFTIPEMEYIFDYVTELMKWIKQNLPTRALETTTQTPYQLYFMKKLWVNIVADRNADLIFYYPQELPKYLNGFYKVNKERAVELAALICIAEQGDASLPQQKLSSLLPKVLPEDIITIQKLQAWRTQILAKMKELANENIGEISAKQKFLVRIAEQKTFGSTFFIATQTNDPTLPENILIAINRSGFQIIDPNTKDILQSYDYSELNFWSAGNTFFQIRFGNMIGASKLLCSTTQGYKMDDLLSSYIHYLNERQ